MPRLASFRSFVLAIGCSLLPVFHAGAEPETRAQQPASQTPRTVMVRVRVDSQAPGYEGRNALDGNPQTMWHTVWGAGEPKHPHQIVVDLGRSYEIAGFSYQARAGAGNGTIKEYECHVAAGPEAQGKPVARGSFAPTDQAQDVTFAAPVAGRYFILRAFSELRGAKWTSIAELDIHAPGLRFRARSSAAARHDSRAGAGPRRSRQGPDHGTLAGALEFARQTLEFVEQSAPRPTLAAELRKLEDKVARREPAPEEAPALLAEVRRLRRRIIFSHPLLDFDRLLVNQRPLPGFSHQTDQYLGRYSGPGPGLVILENWKGQPRATPLLKGKLPEGSVLHPDLSFDARRVLFSYCDHSEPDRARRRFFIYEIGIDGTGLRQITGTESDPLQGYAGRATALVEDFDPCYLPDRGIAFVSTRNQGGVRCHHGGRYCPTYTLYRCEADGSRIRPMVYGEANEWDPSVLPDGRIIWTRWDYINRHDTVYQSLWTIRPDGTGTAHFYGNYSRNPCSIAEARIIPGSHKVVATATAHHSYTAGSIIVVDPLAGQDGEAPLERITPEVAFPETEGWSGGAFATPWPLSEDLFLAAGCAETRTRRGRDQSANAYGIYLVDTLGGRELIYRDPQVSCFAPIPVVPRRKPRALAPAIEPQRFEELETGNPTGTFYVQNVYQSTEAIEPGSVRSLRVVEVLPQPAIRVPDRSQVLFETAKRIVGTVPVAEDGSVAFSAPAGRPLLFQLLDEHGMAVMGMRTFVFLHPGETVSCAGCHEPRHSSPGRLPPPPGVQVRDLEPPVGPRYEGGLSFVRTVQPVLDRYCIGCHGLEKAEGGVRLVGTMDPGPVQLGRVRASAAYHSLISRPALVAQAVRNRETPASKPMDYYSHAGRLARMLLEGHQDAEGRARVQLDSGSFQRIVDWLDLNAEFYGDYSWNKPEWREIAPEGERALREHIRRTFGAELAAQPFAALVNMGMIDESRILKAPLAVEAGGWGQLGAAWKSTSDPGYREMHRLVEAALKPLEYHDLAGTCNRPQCECRSCWVREARQEWKEQHAPAVAHAPDE